MMSGEYPAGADDAGHFDAAKFVAGLSHRPGVYRMYNDGGEIIYVGKAHELKKRVASDFSGRA